MKNWKWMCVAFCVIFSTFGNSQDVHEVRFYPTKLYVKGGYELKLFNNYYTEAFSKTIEPYRQDFFTSFLQILIGSDKNLNWGVDLKYRSAAVSFSTQSKFVAFPLNDVNRSDLDEKIVYRRNGLSGIGPRVKYAVMSKKGSISISHAFYIPTMDKSEGNNEFGFIDWEHPQIYNNLFFEKKLNSKSNFFLDAGFHFENLGSFLFNDERGYAQILTPFTGIYNYYPNYNMTIYGMLNFSPRFGLNDSGSQNELQLGSFAQTGIGYKYLFHQKFEAELLYTQFYNFGANSRASTFNVGIRYYRN